VQGHEKTRERNPPSLAEEAGGEEVDNPAPAHNKQAQESEKEIFHFSSDVFGTKSPMGGEKVAVRNKIRVGIRRKWRRRVAFALNDSKFEGIPKGCFNKGTSGVFKGSVTTMQTPEDQKNKKPRIAESMHKGKQ